MLGTEVTSGTVSFTNLRSQLFHTRGKGLSLARQVDSNRRIVENVSETSLAEVREYWSDLSRTTTRQRWHRTPRAASAALSLPDVPLKSLA
ncbi:hypothetical protein LshimejAT787_0905270 [Lyophyllum shimeji]|uniref:Uncharacterized protein n=1 Tax=Lyophyllum shimeji TaxID=47721 RepID=A0A9P3PU01_LYOSH|nr:hypothetical protein LshimejAT787_0905270 [Lyophyllum shimeji]